MTMTDVILQVRALSRREQKALAKWLIDALVDDDDETNEPLPSITDLRGLGKESWEGVDAQAYVNYTREDWIRETEHLRQIPPKPEDRLLGKFANPNIPEMNEEDFHAQMHTLATEWEQELDEFTNDQA